MVKIDDVYSGLYPDLEDTADILIQNGMFKDHYPPYEPLSGSDADYDQSIDDVIYNGE